MTTPTDFDAVLAAAATGVHDGRRRRASPRPRSASRRPTPATSAASATRPSCCWTPATRPLAVVKLSNAAEDPATLDMEALAVLHARRVDPGLPLAMPWRVPDAAGDGRRRVPGRRRVGDGDPPRSGSTTSCPVASAATRVDLSDAALGGWGETTARLGRALRGFFHPAAQRTMLWDVQHASRTRDLIPTIRDAGAARPRRARPRSLRRGRRPGLAVAARPGRPRRPDDRQRPHRRRRADHRHRRLRRHEPLRARGRPRQRARLRPRRPRRRGLPGGPTGPRRLPADHARSSRWSSGSSASCLATRAAVTITISSWRSAEGLEDAAFAERYNAPSRRRSTTLLDTGWDEVARRFGAEVAARRRETGLVARRRDGASARPSRTAVLRASRIQIVVRAQGVWMTDIDGRRYLDAYNNVPCVGHAHPRVTEAIARQARRLNTNLRYLHEAAIELAERLVATMSARPRHRVLRELGVRGERPRLAPRHDRDRSPWRAVHRLRVPRHLATRSPRSRPGDLAGRASSRTMSRPGDRPTRCRGADLDGARSMPHSTTSPPGTRRRRRSSSTAS